MENDGNEEVGAIGDLTQLTVELVCILCVHDKAKSLLVWFLNGINPSTFCFVNRCGERCY